MKIKSLKNNIITYLLLFTVIPLCLGSLVIMDNIYKSEKKSIFHKHNQLLNQAKDDLNMMINDVEKVAVYIQKKYPTTQYNLLSGLVSLKKNISSILILDNDGILLDLSSSGGNVYKGYDYSNAKYFKEMKSGKLKYWTKVYLAQDSNLPSIAYSFRLDENKIVVLIVNLTVLDTFSKRFTSNDGSSMVSVVGSDDVYISYGDHKSSVLQRKTILRTELYKNYIEQNKDLNKQIEFVDENSKYIGLYGIFKRLNWKIIIKEKYDSVFHAYYTNLWFMVFFILVLILVASYFSFKFSKSILRPLSLLSKKMDALSSGKDIVTVKGDCYTELELLSSNFILMNGKIKDREKLNRIKDKQIYNSSKMARMGEMIGNIAHQWRQPLSVISTAASGILVQKEYGVLTDEKFKFYCDSIVDSTQHLSETIDTFRNFIKDKKERKEIILQDEINSTLKILETSLSNNHIQLFNNIDVSSPLKVTVSMGELAQVIINIIQNAKDILVEKKIVSPTITIELKVIDQRALITIEDNAGGVPESIITKIFDPYFTTKHQSQGTGLGLHMSYRIVNESLKGELSIKNTQNGAKFYIFLPLK